MKEKIEQMIREAKERRAYAERSIANRHFAHDSHTHGYWTAVSGENGSLAERLQRILDTEV